jgi:stearoyl-CoA desaturase (delta-9 desaturase)
MTAAERNARAVQIGMVGFHIACLGAFFTGVSPVALLVCFVLYVARAFGVTAGFHRLLAHGAFKAGRVTQFGLTLLGSLACQGGPLWWVSHHRNHHRYTETPRDIHSPQQRGFWYSHIGWMMDKACFETSATNVKELHKFPEIKALQRFYPLILLLEAITLYALGAVLTHFYPGLGTSGVQMLVWGFFISTVSLWHATFMVNSVCHIWGDQAYDTNDRSTNNWIVATLTLGEGWHNNHHKFSYSARHGLEWWQLDVTWLVLRLMNQIGLIRDLKLPRQRTSATAMA